MLMATTGALQALLTPSETGLEFLHGMTQECVLTGVDAFDRLGGSGGRGAGAGAGTATPPPPPRGLKTGTLVEVTGGPRKGKTRLLLQAASKFALSRPAGGHGTVVLYFDMDGKFDAQALRREMSRQQAVLAGAGSSSSSSASSPEQRAAALVDGLARVLVLRCDDAAAARLALLHAEYVMATRPVGLLVFDNPASAFFEHRVAALHEAASRGGGGSGYTSSSFGSFLAHKVDGLRRRHRVIVLVAVPTMFGKISAGSSHLLGRKWDQLRKHRVNLG